MNLGHWKAMPSLSLADNTPELWICIARRNRGIFTELCPLTLFFPGRHISEFPCTSPVVAQNFIPNVKTTQLYTCRGSRNAFRRSGIQSSSTHGYVNLREIGAYSSPQDFMIDDKDLYLITVVLARPRVIAGKLMHHDFIFLNPLKHASIQFSTPRAVRWF
jgi:hypothetical protein